MVLRKLGRYGEIMPDKEFKYVFAVVNVRNGDILIVKNSDDLLHVIDTMFSMGVGTEDFYVRTFQKVDLINADTLPSVN
jgi:hypothetical protein